MVKDLRREQIDLLRFEKQLLGLGGGLAALTAGAASSAENIVGPLAAEQAAEIQSAYLKLVETVQAAHNSVEASALAAGADLLQTKGDPKNVQLLELARSALGIG